MTEFFKLAWSGACDSLRAADLIVFLGYRFPPTDTEAAMRLLGAVADNVAARGKRGADPLLVHLVLGSDASSLARLRALLEGTGYLDVQPTNFYATDHMLTVGRTIPTP